MKTITVVGSTNIDIVVQVARFPESGETVSGTSLNRYPGGKGANQAVACGKLYKEAVFVGAFGSETDNSITTDSLNAANVDISNCVTIEDEVSGTALITVDREGKNSIVVIPGSNGCLTPEVLAPRLDRLKAPDYLLLQMEIPIESIRYLLARYREKTVLIVNPAPVPADLALSELSGVDYLIPNESELALLSGMPVCEIGQVVKAADVLLKAGVKKLVVTVGSKGAVLITKEKALHIEPVAVKVVDTTAAGDTFIGAFASALSWGMSDQEAVMFANEAATIAVSRVGAQTSIPTREEVNEFIRTRASSFEELAAQTRIHEVR